MTVMFGVWNSFSPIFEPQGHGAQRCCEFLGGEQLPRGHPLAGRQLQIWGRSEPRGLLLGFPPASTRGCPCQVRVVCLVLC